MASHNLTKVNTVISNQNSTKNVVKSITAEVLSSTCGAKLTNVSCDATFDVEVLNRVRLDANMDGNVMVGSSGSLGLKD